MVNLDMIGRSRGRVEAGGLASASSLRVDVDTAAKTAGIDARPGGPGAGRSDDSSFLDRRIPSLHFFTGSTTTITRQETTGRASTQPGPRASRRSLELAASGGAHRQASIRRPLRPGELIM